MEYLPYPDLVGWSYPPECLFKGTADDASRILLDMASALDYLHGQGICHNDIKPGNILFDRTRGPVLIDLGLASFGDKAANGGTPWYLPPEFMETVSRGPKGDVYALGVTMLYVLGKIRLPEREPGWDIFKVGKLEQDWQKMKAWVIGTQAARASLRDSGVELIVTEMLIQGAQGRVTAQEVVRRMQNKN